MKTRPLAVLAVIASLLFASSWSVSAQGPEPPTPPPPGGQPLQGPAPSFWQGDRLFPPEPAAPALLGVQVGSAASVALGQPGFSHRYVAEFGEPTVGYFEDSGHLAWPDGVGVQGTNVWIADSEGERAMQFTNGGSFVWQIGQAGFRHSVDETTIEYVADVAVDGSGNIWLVDTYANHVVKFDSGGNYVSELGVLWESGFDNDHFRYPFGIAFDSADNVYVAEMSNDRVQVFDSSGVYIATLGVTNVTGADNDHFHTPRHITVDDSDLLYVADSVNHRVQIFDVSDPSAITYVATIGVSGVAGSDNAHLDRPDGVHVDATKIYVADTNNHRIQIFDRTTRGYLNTIGTGTKGSGNDQFRYPADVAVDSAGNIFVADVYNARVQQFNSSLNYVRTYGVTGVPYLTDGYHHDRPSGIAVAGDGSMIVTEEKGHRLVKLNSAGVPQWTVGVPGVCDDDNAHLCGPQDVDLDSSGRAYVADAWNDRVQIFDSIGAYVATLGTGSGDGDYQFLYPNGIALDSANNIYVADSENSRVQIYNSSRIYVATLGETGVSGNNNAHFDWPQDVDVDAAGNIYVLDHGNHRVQVFNSSRAYVRTLGESGVPGTDFGHFENPVAVAVDAAGRTYVADQWGTRIKVYDGAGAFLTEFGNWGNNAFVGNLAQAEGIALDAGGNVYLAEYWIQRIQKFAPGVPGWLQTNINGFGYPDGGPSAMTVFNGQMYVGGWADGAGHIWRTSTGNSWAAVVTDGFGASNHSIDSLAVFGDTLFAGTADYTLGSPGQIYSSTDGTNWSPVMTNGFGDPDNYAIFNMIAYDGYLYAATFNSDGVNDTGEIWRSSDGNNWASFNLPSIPSNFWWSFEIYDGQLYVGTNHFDGNSGLGWLYRTDGSTWESVTTDGFGDSDNVVIHGLADFDGYLYAATRNFNDGAQVWRSVTGDAGSWSSVISDGFGDAANARGFGLIVAGNYLYLVITNLDVGDQVWRTSDGITWEHIGFDGWGDANNNWSDYSDKNAAVFNGSLYIGGSNGANGGEVWKFLHNTLYLPLVLRSP